MNKYLSFFILMLLVQSLCFAQTSFELKSSQSMLITGKGPGQDAAINPYSDQDCIAIVQNLGESEFSVRIQTQGRIIETITIPPETTKSVKLPKDYELYLDSRLKTKADVKFERFDLLKNEK